MLIEELPVIISSENYPHEKTIWSSVFLVFILLVLSGNPAFHLQSQAAFGYAAAAVILSIVYTRFITKEFFFKYIILIYGFVLIFIIQYFNLGYVSPVFVLGFIIKIYIGAIIFEVLGKNFAPIFFDTMVKVCLLSFPFYIIHIYFGDNVLSKFFIGGNTQSVGFYTFRSPAPLETSLRNSGMFWEPGAFQAFINLCLFMNFYRMPFLLKKKKISLLIIFFAFASTQSTTGYAIFALLFGIYVILYSKISKIVILVIIALFISLSVYLYYNLDFLGDKIKLQYELSLDTYGEYEPDRLGAFLFDLHYIRKNPLTGNGFSAITAYADHPMLRASVEQGKDLGHGNGFSGFIARAGLLGMFWYLFTIVYYRKDEVIMDSFLLCFLMIFLLQGEHFLNFPFFLGLAFFKFNNSDNDFLSSTYYLS